MTLITPLNVTSVIFLSGLFAGTLEGQVIDPGVAQQQAIPGVGHSYIGIGGEIVNPADGSISFHLPIQTAAGRQLSLPFAINFDSAGTFYLLPPNPSGAPNEQKIFAWTTARQQANAMPFNVNGWSYTLPFYQAQAFVSSVQQTSCGDPAECSGAAYNYCFSANDYTFRGFGETLLPAPFENQWPYGNNPQQQGVCTQTTYPFGGGGAGGSGYLFAPPPQGTNDQPPLTVTEWSGISYQFPPIAIEPNPSPAYTTVYPFGALAQTITDSNGNQLNLQGPNIYVGGGNPGLLAGSYLDTLGRTAVSWSGLGNANGDQITLSGMTGNISVKWTSTNITLPQTASTANGSTPCTLYSSSMATSVVSEIDLPNNTKYLFSYGGAWGLLTKITFPDGGYVRYVWGTNPASQSLTEQGYCQSFGDSAAITDRYVSYDGTNEVQHQVFSGYKTTFAAYYDLESWTAKQTVVTDYELVASNWLKTRVTTYNYIPYNLTVPLEQSIVVQDGNGKTMRTTNKTWLDPYFVIGDQTILDNGQGMTTLNCPNGDRALATYEYDFQSAGAKPTDPTCAGFTAPNTLSAGLNTAAIGPLLRQTNTAYSSLTANIDKPLSVIVSDGAGTKLKETDYNYDTTAVVASGTQVGLVPVVSSTSRGNLTSVSQWLNTNSSSLTTTFTYFDTGQVQSMTEPCGTTSCPDMPSSPLPTTIYSYQDSWASGSSTSQTNAYLTKVTDARSHTKAFAYNFSSGELASQTDENNQTTTYSYSDPMLRITDIYGPPSPQNGNAKPHTHYAYVDGTGASVAITDPIGVVSTAFRDGMGHQTQSRTSDPLGTDFVDTAYDGLGRILSVSNPYRTNASHGVTTFAYDALGRKTMQCQPDNGTPTTSCTAGKSYQQWVYSGTQTTFTDENTNSWVRTNDRLGRLVTVVEPSGLSTSYSYDLLNNLHCADQWGTGAIETPCSSSQGRSFAYDSLSRLLTATNPETGTVCYGTWSSGKCTNGYDANGNLTAKTDARNITTSFTYDVLSRMLSKTHSDSTLASCYAYDSATSGVGRLASEWTQTAPCSTSGSAPSNFQTVASILVYDPAGRVQSQSTSAPNTPSPPSTTSASYDLSGHQTSISYPDGRVVQNGYDTAGRLNAINYVSWIGSTTNLPQTYFSEASGYDAADHLVNGMFGNGVAYAAGYDNRERMATLAYSTTVAPLWSKQLAWSVNNNLQSQTDLITGVQRQFSYDNLNRLTAAQDIYSTLAVPSESNGATGSTSSSGSGASEPPGATGALPEWTNPDDSNLLTDVGESTTSWIFTNAAYVSNNATAPDGSMTATVVSSTGASGTSGYFDGYITSPADYANETMTGSVWIRTPAASPFSVYLYILGVGPSGFQSMASKLVTVNGTWQQFQVTGLNPDAVGQLELQIGGSGTFLCGSQIQIWHPMLEDEGIAGSSVTNFLPYSQRLMNSSWQTSSATVADNVATAPDQTSTAASLTGSSVSNSVQNPAPFDGMQVVGSVWLRASTAQQVALALVETNTSSVQSTIKSQVENVTTNWTRFQVTGTAVSALSKLSIQIGGNATIAANTPVNVWGGQLELGSTAGPYVVTADTPATEGTSLTNLLTYSQQPTGPSWQFGSTTVAQNTVVAPDGSVTASTITAQVTDSAVANIAPNPALYDGATITGSVYLRSNGSQPQTINLYFYAENASGTHYFTSQTETLTPTWQRFAITGTAPVGLGGLALQIGGGSSFSTGQTVDIWASQIEIASHAGPYIATSALPIITGSEPTNILPSSQSISGTNWQATGTVTSNGATAPDGTMTAAVFTGTNGAAGPPATGDNWVKAFVPNPSLYDGETVTVSVYLRVTSGTPSVNLYLESSGDQGSANPPSSVAKLTTTWQRFALTGTLQNGLTAAAFQIGGGNSLPYGTSIQIWGAQFVLGSVAAPYTPTSTTTTVGQPGTPVPTGLYQLYSYDSFGNILQNGSFQTSYTANNQIFGDAYDLAGNILSDGMNVITWDAESRMATADGATYIYDAEGNRVEKQGASVVDTVYFGGQPIARYTAGQWTDLIYGPTGLLAEVPGTQTGAPVYRVTDNLGTNVGSLLANGNFVDPIDHTPFGQVFTGNTSDPYLFTGKERDTESGLDYFGARYMSSNMGRFTSPDTSDGPDPVPFGDLENPQSLNLYSYVGNNPVNAVDDDGHSSDCGGGGDPSVVCLVTTAIDKIKDFFSGTSVTTSQTITPPATPAPGVPEGAPGTATGGLIQAQNDARANPRFQPNASTTFCNMASCNIGQHAGSNMGPLMTNGIPNLANTDYNNFAHSGSYHQVGRAEAQRLANMGKVVYGVYKEPGHGHIITVRPNNGPYTGSGSPSTGPDDPIINDIGRHIGVYPLSQQPSAGFRSGVIFYAPN